MTSSKYPFFYSSLAVGGVISVTQTALPRHFDIELADWVLIAGGWFTLDTSSATSLGAIVSIVYSSSIVMQYVGGMLADRYSLKYIYVLCWFLQIVMLAAITITTGLSRRCGVLAVLVKITMFWKTW